MTISEEEYDEIFTPIPLISYQSCLIRAYVQLCLTDACFLVEEERCEYRW